MMKKTLFTLLVSIASCHCFAQVMSTPYDDLPARQYADKIIALYDAHLQLSHEQKQQAYDALLKRKYTLDSFKTHNVQVTTAELWAVNISVDKKFKEILTTKQYLMYEDMGSTFFAILRNPDSVKTRASTH